ncbi:MAG: 2-phospho-L-lactate guanylyltransferase [Nitrososphaerales archaeon]
MKETVAIVPVREFEDTKLRLKGLLSNTKRAELTQKMLYRVLRALELSSVASVIVVCSDTTSTKKIARVHKKVKIIEEAIHHGGVNNAMMDGLAFSAKETNAKCAMLVPSDLPLLTSKAIDHALSKLSRYDLIINPSKMEDGTNLLLFDIKKGSIPLHYDDNSYRRHLEEARLAKRRYLVFRKKEFSFDVDSTLDLKNLIAIYGVKTFEDMLVKMEG